jgi:hypothetical protein
MQVITYFLRDKDDSSDQYYRDVANLTDLVMAKLESQVEPVVEALRSSLAPDSQESLRTLPEYVFELLTLGVLYRIYASRSVGFGMVPQHILTGLVRLRRRGGWVKGGADLIRGFLGRLFLAPVESGGGRIPHPTLNRVDRLLGWLTATGEYDQEVKRIRVWLGFLRQRSDEGASVLQAAIRLAEWFEVQSLESLGQYTSNVDQFLREMHPRYLWREDAIFCGRKRVEYHLNMMGTEILNRTLRDGFLQTESKLVLVPPCMKARSDAECKAHDTRHGARCARCAPACRVRRLTELGEEIGFGVLMLPDELRVFEGDTGTPSGADVGIVGVSCVLTNAIGGLEMREMGVPAQGVLLDYCGCNYHWHKDGIPTDINTDHLLRVLGVERTIH